MKRFTLEIELGNEAMRSQHDIALALGAVIDRLYAHEGDGGRQVLDVNGNTVGGWRIEYDTHGIVNLEDEEIEL